MNLLSLTLRSLLFLFTLSLPIFLHAQSESTAPLWPPRGNNRPLVAASQSLWWNKQNPEARKLKARALDFTGRYAEAEKAALYALLVAPQDPEVQRILGRSLLHQNRLASAKVALERAGQLGDPLSASLATMLRPDRMSAAPPSPHLSRALVQILEENGSCVGSGCFLSENGDVLTAAHVVAGKKRFSVRDALGRVFPVKAVCPGDFSVDAVILRTSAHEPIFLSLAPLEPNLSDPLLAIGFPLSLDLPITSRGVVRSLPSTSRSLLTTVPLMPGQSGSPLLNAQGQVVGVASRGSLSVQGGGAPSRSEAVGLPALTRLLDFAKQPNGFSEVRLLPKWTRKSPFFDPAVATAEQIVLTQNLTKADEALSEAIEHHPDDSGLYLRRANVRASDRRFVEAESDALLAVRHCADDPEPHRFLCALFFSQGRKTEAIAQLNLAYQCDREDADTAEGLAELYLSSGDYSLSLPPAENAARLNPESSRAWSVLSAARLATGSASQARAAAETATQKGPDDPRAWVQLAASANLARDFPAAVLAGEKATQLAPAEARAWLNLATARAGVEQLTQALLDAQRAAQLEPTNPTCWKLLAALYQELQQPEQSQAASAKADSLNPTHR